MRTKPNILIAGTPGTGKSRLVDELMKMDEFKEFKNIHIGTFAKEHGCVEDFDALYKCDILDEDKLIEELEKELGGQEGGFILEYHSGDLIPPKLLDIVVVLRTNNTILYDRLKERGYDGKKLQDNIECEIFQTILEEARECHDNVTELTSEKEEDMKNNCSSVLDLLEKFCEKDNGL